MTLRNTVCLLCNSSKKPLFRFSKDPSRLQLWLERIGKEELLAIHSSNYIYNHGRLCAAHFSGTSFTDTLKRRLLMYALPNDLRIEEAGEPLDVPGTSSKLHTVNKLNEVPSENEGYHRKFSELESDSKDSDIDSEYEICDDVLLVDEDCDMDSGSDIDDSVNIDMSCDVESTQNESVVCQTDLHLPCQSYSPCTVEHIEKESVECQTDFTQEDLYDVQKAYIDTISELIEVKDKISKLCISEETFKHDDEKTRYYTGLQNFSTLLVVFNLLQNDLPHVINLSKFQQVILTLMRLKLNLDFRDLSYRFCVSLKTASKVFSTCLSVMSTNLEHFLLWPDREALIKKLPLTIIESYGNNVVIVINSIEVSIEKHSNLSSVESDVKAFKTMKFLIGISPHGSIAFISSAFDGNTPDQHIVENYDVFKQLLPDDVIICDRGFGIQNKPDLRCKVLKIPERSRKVKKLFSEIESFHDLNCSKNMESVVVKLKQYRILHRGTPFATTFRENDEGQVLIDQIVKVCASLLNISSLVVSLD